MLANVCVCVCVCVHACVCVCHLEAMTIWKYSTKREASRVLPKRIASMIPVNNTTEAEPCDDIASQM